MNMFVFACICLLLISVQFSQCDQFIARYEISLGSTISIDASVPHKNGIVFYDKFLIKPYSVNTINVYNFTDHKFGFGILQVHSCWYNLTLSYHKKIQRNYSENGTNLGFTLYPLSQSPQQFFVYNYNYFTSVNISIAFIPYNKTAPQPSGCNMEYSVADAPVLVRSPNKEFLTVDTPLAANSADQLNEDERCNASLSYMGYRLYLKRGDYTCESFFDGIKSFITVESTLATGELQASVPGLVNRRAYTSIPGTGIVFQTVVKGKGGTSAYIPTFTMSCSPPLWETNCDVFAIPTFYVLAGVLIIVGIIRAYFGEVLTILGVFIDGFIVGLLITFYIIHMSNFNINEENQIIIIIGSGLGMASLLISLHVFFVKLHHSIALISHIIVGYLLGAFTVYMTDDILYDYKSSGWIYEIIFIGYIFIMIIIFPPCHSFGSIVLSATWGSFCIIQALCYIHGNHLNYVILNALRYTSVEGFKQVHSTPAVNGEDITFLLLWLIFAMSGILFQLELNRQRQNVTGDDTERTPLISRMTSHGSDEVFESPLSNIRFLKGIRSQRD